MVARALTLGGVALTLAGVVLVLGDGPTPPTPSTGSTGAGSQEARRPKRETVQDPRDRAQRELQEAEASQAQARELAAKVAAAPPAPPAMDGRQPPADLAALLQQAPASELLGLVLVPDLQALQAEQRAVALAADDDAALAIILAALA